MRAPTTRLLAAGGIVGPVVFIAAWAGLGARTPGYSPVRDQISRLAASGASTKEAMTAGFLAFGVGLPLYAAALREELPGWAWVTAAATGVATIGAAVTPLDVSPTIDRLHGLAAGAGYATLAATPFLAAGHLAEHVHPMAGRASRIIGVASGLALLASTWVGPHGLLQRAGLTIGDTWVVATALWLMSRARG